VADQPFRGITVVEFGQFVAVPYASQLLADGGAHVIKVEPLEGDPTRHLAPIAPGITRHFLLRNRGKHCLPLNLKHAEAPRIIEALLGKADVVLTNMRPGLARELGLDYESIGGRYPRIVVGNVTGFGERGPDAGLAGMDLVLQARSGLMATGGRMRDGLPAVGESPIADYMCAVLLAFGIATALFERETSRRGGHVDVSLLLSALLLQNNLMVRVESVDGERHDGYGEWLAEARASGLPFAEQMANMPGSRPSAMTSVYYRCFATRDSAIAVACVSPGLRRRLMEATGLEDPALSGHVPEEEVGPHYASLQARIEAVLAARSTAEWQAHFNALGIPASAVRFPIELLTDQQASENEMLHDFEHPSAGRVRVLGAPLGLNGDGFRPAHLTQPLGVDTVEILGELGFSDEEAQRLIAGGLTRTADQD
jgi:crotonobetainyl-CoA:carnitine CoA-transferase CaiB-like acyl-CoA transferase